MASLRRGLVNVLRVAAGSVGLLVFLAICAGPVRAQPKPTAALIEIDKSAVTGLLESRLLENDSVGWVERTEIDRVLKEQQLQAAFGAAGVKERSSLGKLLKADLLILVRETDSLDKKTRVIECAVCETSQGLRLQIGSVPSDSSAEAMVATLEKIVTLGLAKSKEEIVETVAVSPLVSDDLGFQYNHLQSAYAKVIESRLQALHGVALVELAEARALAAELALTERDRIERRLPIYVTGKFKHSRQAREESVTVELVSRRGADELARFRAGELPPHRVATWLGEQSLRLIHGNQEHALPPARDEAQQLGLRAREFCAVSNWEEGIALLEAALLLDPENQELRRDAILAIGRLAKSEANTFGDKQRFAQLVESHRRGMEHLELYLQRAGKLLALYETAEPDFITEFDFSFLGWAHSTGSDQQVNEQLQRLQKQRTEWFLRLARMRAHKGYLEEALLIRAVWSLPDEKRLDHSVAFVEEFADAPNLDAIAIASAPRRGILVDDPIVHEYVDRLAKSPFEKVRASAAAVRKAVTMAPKWDERPATTLPSLSERYFKPVEIDTEIPSKSAYFKPHLMGCLSVAPKLDVYWAHKELFSMSEPGKLHNLHRSEVGQFQSVIWDGKFVWATVVVDKGPHSLVALDPRSEKVYVFAGPEGLPVDPDSPARATVKMLCTPLEAGRVAVVGTAGRLWIAVASLDADGRKKVEILHEARRLADPQRPEDGLSTDIAFEPTYISRISGLDDKGGQQRIVIGRSAHHHKAAARPFLVDPKSKRVEIAEFSCNAFRPDMIAAQHDGNLYLLDGYKFRPALVRITFPGKKEVLLESCTQGALWANEGGVQLIGNQMQLLAPKTHGLAMLADTVPWRYNDGSPGLINIAPPDYCLIGVSVSSHYGLIALTSGGPQPSPGKIFQYLPTK